MYRKTLTEAEYGEAVTFGSNWAREHGRYEGDSPHEVTRFYNPMRDAIRAEINRRRESDPGLPAFWGNVAETAARHIGAGARRVEA
jgi:hypothetical protein